MRVLRLVALAAALIVAPAKAQVLDLGSEFVLFVDSTNSAIPDVEPALDVDPDDAGNPVLRLDYGHWASVALAFDEDVGADMTGMLDKTLFLRMRVDTTFASRGPCRADGGNCLSLILFDSFSQLQTREAIHDGTGDAGMRLKWFIPDSLRDGAWHSLAIPLPPATLAELEAQRANLPALAQSWYYTGAFTGTFGIGCCGSSMPTSQDSLWREFDWRRVARIGVHFDWSDQEAGSVYLDDLYIGDALTDVSDWGLAVAVEPSAVSPEDQADDQPASITLRWSGRRGAPHQVQISTDPTFASVDRDMQVSADSLRSENLSAYTTYHWRVRAFGRNQPTAWSAARSFTVGGIGAPSLSAPAEAAVADTQPSFSWTEVSGGISYRLQVATDAAFTSLVVDEAGIPAPPSAGYSLDPGTTYFWRVRAESVAGPGQWSTTGSFSTRQVPPGAPSGRWPVSGTVDVPITTELHWDPATRADSYDFQLSQHASFDSLDASASVTTTSMPLSGLGKGITYHWRVRAVNTGGTSEWVAYWFQTEMEAPPATRTAWPSDGAVETPLRLFLRWDPAYQAQTYRVQVSQSVTFDQVLVDSSGVASDSLRIGPLKPYRVHFWRVMAANRGGESAWSPIASFRTSSNAEPTAVDDLGQVLEDVPAEFAVLNNDTDPEGDALSIASLTSPAFGSASIRNDTRIRYQPALEFSGADSLRYTVSDGRGGEASAWLRITVLPVDDPPPAPDILLPQAGSHVFIEGDPNRLLRVTWNAVQDVDSPEVRYRWEFAALPGMSPVLISRDVGTATMIEVPFGDLAAALTAGGMATATSGTAFHRVVATDGQNLSFGLAAAVSVTRGLMTDVASVELPTEFRAGVAFPNPFGRQVTVPLAVPSAAPVDIRVSDALGRVVWSGERHLSAGHHQVEVPLDTVPSGFYVIDLIWKSGRQAVAVMKAR
ncbi:MAG: cadherin-like domain-containing protein [Rhodothermales bacterium]|nr:cadherin-like domain-containing protein [Rhodothermales bacterium]MBO6779293.1 cadherin-like domain-containing protein [Rhodothermales bacterium]